MANEAFTRVTSAANPNTPTTNATTGGGGQDGTGCNIAANASVIGVSTDRVPDGSQRTLQETAPLRHPDIGDYYHPTIVGAVPTDGGNSSRAQIDDNEVRVPSSTARDALVGLVEATGTVADDAVIATVGGESYRNRTGGALADDDFAYGTTN